MKDPYDPFYRFDWAEAIGHFVIRAIGIVGAITLVGWLVEVFK